MPNLFRHPIYVGTYPVGSWNKFRMACSFFYNSSRHAELVSASHYAGNLSREILKQVQDDVSFYLNAPSFSGS
jgi:hypothetical protein